MAGQQGAASTPAPGQGQGASTGSAGAGAQPKVVFTPEQLVEVNRIASDAAQTAAEDAYRRAQGHTDTTTARVREEVGQRLKTVEDTALLFKAAGHEIPADVLEKAKTATLQQSFSLPAAPSGAAASQPKAGQPGAEGAEGDVIPEGVTIEVLGNTMLAEAGMAKIDATWPEWKLIDQQTEDPVKFVGSINAAIAAYQIRVPPAGGAGGSDGAQGTGAGGKGETPEERWSRMGAHPSGGAGAGAASALPDLPAQELFRMGFDEATRGK